MIDGLGNIGRQIRRRLRDDVQIRLFGRWSCPQSIAASAGTSIETLTAACQTALLDRHLAADSAAGDVGARLQRLQILDKILHTAGAGRRT